MEEVVDRKSPPHSAGKYNCLEAMKTTSAELEGFVVLLSP
jgi:hypothetical protein